MAGLDSSQNDTSAAICFCLLLQHAVMSGPMIFFTRPPSSLGPDLLSSLHALLVSYFEISSEGASELPGRQATLDERLSRTACARVFEVTVGITLVRQSWLYRTWSFLFASKFGGPVLLQDSLPFDTITYVQ